jgi:flagellar hook protein FlgE
MIQGDGFFTAQTADGQKLYTRAGNFSFDSAGNLVTSSGNKILGTSSLMSASGSSTPIYIPQRISTKTQASSTAYSQALTSLNNCSLTSGTFNIVVNGTDSLTLNVNTTTDNTMGKVAASLQSQITAATTNLNPLDTAATAMTTAINFAHTQGASLATADITAITTAADGAITAAGSALSSGYLTQAQHDAIVSAATTAKATAGTLTAGTAMTTAQQTSLNANTTSVDALYKEYSGVTVACDATTNGTIQFGVSGAATSLKFSTTNSNQSNFINATGLNSAALTNNKYTSNVLDYTVNITQATSIDGSTSINTYSIGTDGSIVATYKNGDTLTATLSSDGNTYEFKYVTSDNVTIKGAKVNMDSNVAQVGNFVLQLASITNNEGLLSYGNNLYTAGPNSGDVLYSVGTQMGLGNIASGGYEASNVDLSEQFSNMILAQRAVQANSRVFSTTSSIMDVIVNMGR